MRFRPFVFASLTLLAATSLAACDSDNDADAVDKSELIEGDIQGRNDTAAVINPQDTMRPTPLGGLGAEPTQSGTMNRDTITSSAPTPR